MSMFFKNSNPEVPTSSDGTLLAAAYNTPRVITASVKRYNTSQKEELRRQEAIARHNTWQKDAWEYYDLIGEIWFGANLIAATTSRVRLYVGYIDDVTADPRPIREMGVVPAEIQDAAIDLLSYLDSHTLGGLSGLLKNMALNLFITGDGYLVRDTSDILNEQWSFQSIDSIRIDRSRPGVYITGYPGQPVEDQHRLADNEYFARIYRQHPRFPDDADSSMRPQLDLCDELLLLSKSSRATIRSRLNSGILFMPSELLTQNTGEDEDGSDIIDELTQAAITPIQHEDDPSAIMPPVLVGGKDSIAAVRHISLARSFDEKHQIQIQNVLDRILAGLDLPKDVVAGIGDLKYANASAVEDSLLQNHIQPMVLAICDALTRAYLHPLLVAQGAIEPTNPLLSKIVIWYDPSAIASKPDRESSSRTGLENMALSNMAWRKANGYTENDAPSETEIAQKIAINRGSLSEAVSEAVLRTLIPHILDNIAQQNVAEAGDTGQILNQIDSTAPAPSSGSAPAPEQLLNPTDTTTDATTTQE
jgi:hypothetical protein